MVSNLEHITPFFKQLNTFSVDQQIRNDLTYHWGEFKAVTRAAWAHHYFLLGIDPIYYEIIIFADCVIALLNFIYLNKFLSIYLKSLLSYLLILIIHIILFRPQLSSYMIPKFDSLPFSVWQAKILAILLLIAPWREYSELIFLHFF